MTTDTAGEWLPIDEALTYYHIDRKLLQKWIERGTVQAKKNPQGTRYSHVFVTRETDDPEERSLPVLEGELPTLGRYHAVLDEVARLTAKAAEDRAALDMATRYITLLERQNADLTNQVSAGHERTDALLALVQQTSETNRQLEDRLHGSLGERLRRLFRPRKE